jgi:NADH-quinone oxidoreductase subunit C
MADPSDPKGAGGAPGEGSPSGATPPPPKREPPPDPLKQEVASPPLERLREEHAGAVEEVTYHAGEASVRVGLASLSEVLRFLRDDASCRLDLLVDLCGADFPAEALRFELNYHLYSIPRGHFLRVKVRVAEGQAVPTASGIWATADWFEREIYDLLGVAFEGHPDLRRILLPDQWRGHPLRKEYPLAGYPDQHLRLR